MTLFDHHIHSSRSDGRVSLEDRAKSVAIRPHGVSDHYPWHDLKDHDALRRYMDDAARLGLHVGIEYDLGVAPPLPRTTRDALDYVIGSVHRVTLDGQKVGYDVAGQFLKGRMGPTYGEAKRFADPELQRRILETHLALVREGILETGIDIVGHPTMSPLAALGDPDSAYPLEWQEQLIALCVEHGVARHTLRAQHVADPSRDVRHREQLGRIRVGERAPVGEARGVGGFISGSCRCQSDWLWSSCSRWFSIPYFTSSNRWRKRTRP